MPVASLFRVIGYLLAVLSLYSSAYAQSTSPADQLTEREIGNIPAYGTRAVGEALEHMRAQAWEFRGRGPALARYFLYHQSPPNNSAFFFLLGAVGDTETAQILIRGLPDPPQPEDSVVSRHAGEIETAVGEILQNDRIRNAPAILESLEESLTKARRLAWGEFPAKVIIALIGQLKTPDAAETLQRLADDPDPVIRATTVAALGEAGQSSILPRLEQAMRDDRSPDVRSEAAEALGKTLSGKSVHFLRASLEKETDLRVVDSILESLVSLDVLPEDPKECLKLPKAGWDVEVIRPYFNCWQKTASREALIEQAISGTWAVRALALNALTHGRPLNGPLMVARPVSIHPLFDEPVRAKLLGAAVEVLSQDMGGSPSEDTISHTTAYMTKEAFWEITGHEMATALAFADRIQPMHGRYDYMGRFGASSFLASKDAETYTAWRRPGQLLSAALLALACALTLIPVKTRKFGAGLLAGIVLWIVFMMFETGVQKFPPPPLWVLSVPFMAFLAAGLASGTVASMKRKNWTKLMTSPVAAGMAALLICTYTRWQGWFPIGDGGWALFFDPIGCALLSALASFIISLGLLLGNLIYFQARPNEGSS